MISKLQLGFLVAAATVRAAQPSAPAPVAAPLRDLPWGQINFLHTTDTHGWHAGHLQEASYSSDWGDYVSFTKRMKEKANGEGQDLLIVDTGDRIEGNGLYDASNPKGRYTFEIFKQQNMDIICSGNHELYKKASAENEYNITALHYKDSYLASNLNIIDPTSGNFIPLAKKFRKFTTEKNGIRILAFGFLFDFTGNYNNTVVQPVEDAIKENWFQDVIRDKDIDLIVVIGHVPAHSPEYTAIYRAIRDVRWDMPIQFFGGHWHIRDYAKYDNMAYALASGRYMETVGFMSIDGIKTAKSKDPKLQKSPTFRRRYIDNNLFSYYHHTGLNESTFPTEHGKNVSDYIRKSRATLDLDENFGCAPRDLWMERAKYPGEDSIFTWLENAVLPEAIGGEGRENKSRLAIINTGDLRFDIFKGRFTRDTTYIVFPFTSGFRYIKDVPYNKAKRVLALLNSVEPMVANSASKLSSWRMAPPEQLRFRGQGNNLPTLKDDQTPIGFNKENRNLTPGYTTVDDAGDDGDDTVHSPITFYQLPNCIQAKIAFPEQENKDPEAVDLIFLDFIEPYIILALQYLGINYDSTKDVAPYISDKTFTDLVSEWIQKNWDKNC